MTEVTKVIRAITSLGLGQPLKRAGFIRHSMSFARKYGASLQIVDIQLGKGNSRESGKFTKIGVRFSSFAELLYGKDPMPKNPKEFQCIL